MQKRAHILHWKLYNTQLTWCLTTSAHGKISPDEPTCIAQNFGANYYMSCSSIPAFDSLDGLSLIGANLFWVVERDGRIAITPRVIKSPKPCWWAKAYPERVEPRRRRELRPELRGRSWNSDRDFRRLIFWCTRIRSDKVGCVSNQKKRRETTGSIRIAVMRKIVNQ